MTAISDWCQRADVLIAHPKNCGDRHFEDDGITPGEDHGCYLPTQAEIAAACREIRSGWSEEEEQSRRAKVGPWAVPTCRRMRAERNLED